jgi:hypothetical protein
MYRITDSHANACMPMSGIMGEYDKGDDFKAKVKPQPVSLTMTSTATCSESLGPSGSLNARHETVIVPRCVYFTDGDAVRAWENQKGRLLSSARCEICYHHPDPARNSDDHAQIPSQIDLKAEAIGASCLYRFVASMIKRLVKHRLMAAFDSLSDPEGDC